MSIANEITRLTNAKAGIKTALEGKGVTVPADAKLDTYGSLVNSIESGVDTSDANAVAGDIVKGKTVYVNGEKVTGTMKEEISLNNGYDEIIVNNEDNRVYFKDTLNSSTEKHYINPNTEIMISAPFDILDSELGITADKIKKDEVILGITGTLEPKLPTYASVATSWNSVEVIDDTAQKFIRTSGTIMTSQTAEQNEKANIEIQYSRIVDAISLTPDKIKLGESVLGVSGTYQGITVDKTIQAEDAELETVQEITGNNDIGLSITSNPLTQSKLFEQGSMIEMHPTFEQLAAVLGITPDKIKAGEIICGVEGTYAG